MSISIRRQPQSLTPCYNQMIIAVTSSNQSLDSFQFVGDIYVNGTFSTRMKVPVNPEGYGVFDIHRHVENGITYDFNPELWGWNIATNSFATYSVQFSEEFRFEWPFVDNFFSSGSLGFVGTTEPLFNIGDEIFVEQGATATEPSYSGVATITSITQSGLTWSIVTNKPFTTSTPVNGGTISLANFGLNILAVTASTGELYAWNGVYSFLDYINYDYTDYTPNTTAPYAEWLTNMPDNYEVGTHSRVKFLAYKQASNEQKDLMIQTNTGTYRITSAFSADVENNANHRLTMVGVGPYELLTWTSSIIGWTSSIINADTKTYSVWTRNQILQQDTEAKVFKIKDYCSRYEKIQLLFMDKKGSFVPFTFNKVNRHNKNYNRVDYQQHYGKYAPASNNWGYNTYDRGRKSIDNQITEVYTVISDWVNQSTSNYLMELMESPEVYWVKEDGVTVAINITSNATERKQTINDQVINYTLTFELSNKNMVQRG